MPDGLTFSGLPSFNGNLGTENTTFAAWATPQWLDEIKRELDDTLIMSMAGTPVPDKYKSGNHIKMPTMGRMGVYGKQRGVPVQLQAYDEGSFEMFVKRHIESSFAVDDIAAMLTDYDFRAEYGREVAYALARDFDNWLLGYRPVLVHNSQKINSVDASSADDDFNLAAILSARLMLDKAKVPQRGRIWVVSPAQAISLFYIDQFTQRDYGAPDPYQSGVIGSLMGDPVYVSTNLVKNSTTGYTNGRAEGSATAPTPGVYDATEGYSPYWPNYAVNGDVNGAGQHTELTTSDTLTVGKYSALYCHPTWLKYWMPIRPTVEATREPTLLADAIIAHQMYDAKVYRSDHAVVVESSEAG